MATEEGLPKDVRPDASPDKENGLLQLNPMEVAKGVGNVTRDDVVDIIESKLRSGSATLKGLIYEAVKATMDDALMSTLY